MHLADIRLEHFRCYRLLELELPPGGIRLAGANASGKTSFIEAIQLLSMMKSGRAGAERELINWDSNVEYGLPPFARVSGSVEGNPGADTIEIILTVDPSRPAHTRKQIKIDGQPRRAIDSVGTLKTVLFEPEDMDLILGSPSVRRRYVDAAISTIDATYLRSLSQYNKILEQRNSLLKSIRELPRDRRSTRIAELDYWDEELISRAAYIVSARLRHVAGASEALQAAFASLLGDQHLLGFSYVQAGEVETDERLLDMSITDPSNAQRRIARQIETQLESKRNEELARGTTAVGPHRDDLSLTLDQRPISSFGSRGQQRLAVVSLKLAEVEMIRSVTTITPVLLLDDVLSELDDLRQQRLLSQIGGLGGQVIVTATDVGLLQSEELEALPLFHVLSGQLRPSE
jgi:DNA replication and repair protein RecF